MAAGAQEFLVLAIVGGAVTWLVRDRLRRRREGAACDSCALMKAARDGAASPRADSGPPGAASGER